MIAHWDDVRVVRREEGHIGGDWQSLVPAGVARVIEGLERAPVLSS